MSPGNPGVAVITAEDDHGDPIISVHMSGRIFWHGEEVFTDEEFRGAMKDLIRQLGMVQLTQ